MTQKRNTITVLLDLDSIARLDKMADKMGLSRSKVASNLVSGALVEVEFFDKTGLLRLASWIEWLIAKVKTHEKEVEKNQPNIEKQTITVSVPEQDVEYIGKVADKFFFTRAKFAANMIVANVPTLETLEKIGLVDAVLFFHDLKEQAKKISMKKSEGNSISV